MTEIERIIASHEEAIKEGWIDTNECGDPFWDDFVKLVEYARSTLTPHDTHGALDYNKPLPCPYCGIMPLWGLTPRTGCQLHGEPIQHLKLSCKNKDCHARPEVKGGDKFRYGETGEWLKKGNDEARELTIKRWNTRTALTRPSREEKLLEALKKLMEANIATFPDISKWDGKDIKRFYAFDDAKKAIAEAEGE
jgi:hypothetical protein